MAKKDEDLIKEIRKALSGFVYSFVAFNCTGLINKKCSIDDLVAVSLTAIHAAIDEGILCLKKAK